MSFYHRVYMDTTSLRVSRHTTFPLYVCASERIKLIGTTDGRFPDFGHHLEKEMGGLWLHPIKLLDGFWLRLKDIDAANVDVWTIADSFENRAEGNVFFYDSNLGHTPIRLTRSQIAPEMTTGDNGAGIIVDYEVFNSSAETRRLELEFLAKTDLRPVWFSDEHGIADELDAGAWLPDEKLFLAKDTGHEWYAAIGSVPAPEQVEQGIGHGPENTAGQGVGVSFFYTLSLRSGERRILRFIIAGSCVSRAGCLDAYHSLLAPRDFWAEKQARYAALLNRSRLTIEDKKFETIFNWIKVNTDWLIMDTVNGRALAAGLPEYPWWFACDNTYSLQGVLAMGHYELCRDTLRLLLDSSEKFNGNGRIPHEVTTMGLCAHPGNTQETAHFISMVWLYYEWTGDRDFLDLAFPVLQKSVAWLRDQDDDNDGFPSGYGILEIPGLNSEMLDTAVYTAQAYNCFAALCQLKGLDAQADEYQALSERTVAAINTVLWDEEAGLYCDACTSSADVRSHYDAILGQRYGAGADKGRRILDEALTKKEKLPPEAESGCLLNYGWIISTPMETGIAPREKALRALEQMHSGRFIGEYGMYLSGIFQDAIMTINTGVMAVAQARYGFADRALALLEKMFACFGRATPGCISEMLPDYGCFAQAWTIYAAQVPVTRYFFGIQPSASQNRLRVAPCMPSAWPFAKLRRLRILDGELSLCYQRNSEGCLWRLEYTGSASVVFVVPEGYDDHDHEIMMNNGQLDVPLRRKHD
jgi:hypothetical protein